MVPTVPQSSVLLPEALMGDGLRLIPKVHSFWLVEPVNNSYEP